MIPGTVWYYWPLFLNLGVGLVCRGQLLDSSIPSLGRKCQGWEEFSMNLEQAQAWYGRLEQVKDTVCLMRAKYIWGGKKMDKSKELLEELTGAAGYRGLKVK